MEIGKLCLRKLWRLWKSRRARKLWIARGDFYAATCSEDAALKGAATKPVLCAKEYDATVKKVQNALTPPGVLANFLDRKIFPTLDRGGASSRHYPWHLSQRRFSSPRASENIARGYPASSWHCVMQALPLATSFASLRFSRRTAN